MKVLGGFSHIAMDGVAASDKIFRLIDLPEMEQKVRPVPEDCSIRCDGLRFSYEMDREILKKLIWRSLWAALPPLWENPVVERHCRLHPHELKPELH